MVFRINKLTVAKFTTEKFPLRNSSTTVCPLNFTLSQISPIHISSMFPEEVLVSIMA
jgi:hypothetical protein